MIPATAPVNSAAEAPNAPSGMDTLRFLRCILPPTGLYIVARLAGKGWRHQVCESLEETAAFIQRFDSQGAPTYHACASYREPSVAKQTPGGTIRHQVRTHANVRALRSFFMDLDCGEGKGFVSQGAAIDGLVAFCSAAGLPLPMVISSGGGIHVYWTLTEEIGVDAWRQTAAALKALAHKLEFHADPACTADPARVLRTVGTWNRKIADRPRAVELVAEADPVGYADFNRSVFAALSAQGIKAPEVIKYRETKHDKVNEQFGVQQNFPPCSALKIADRCPQLARMRDTKGCIPEPLWYAGIQLMCHAVEGDELIHEWSDGYPRYSREETDRKIRQVRAQGLGPTLCTTFESRNPGGCDGCSFKDNISTPAQLGRAENLKIPSPPHAQTPIIVTQPAVEVLQPGAPGVVETGHEFGGTAPTVQSPVIVNFAEPVPAARAIIESQYTVGAQRTLHFWQGEFRTWTGSHYAVLPIADVRELLYRVGSGFPSAAVKKRHVDDVLDALRAFANLSNTIASPSWLAAGINGTNPRSLIPMMNGILDIETGTLIPKTPSLFSSYSLPFDYDPHAPHPDNWFQFLCRLWDEDCERIALLQEWFGYCLTQRTEQQKALLFVGPKRGGKGTVGRVLTSLLGKENVVSPRLASLGNQFGLESLIGKQLALVSDARLGNKADLDAVAENILRITGEDQISIPRKFLPDYTATLPTRIMILTNEPPRFTDGSGALPSRFIVLNSEVSFYGREDHTLTSKLRGELPGIFNWSLEGLDRLLKRGYFQQPTAARELVEQIEFLAAPVKAFLADKCETNDPTAEVSVNDLFMAWIVWCTDNGREHPGNLQAFGRDLRTAFPRVKISQHRSQGDRGRYYVGIRIKR